MTEFIPEELIPAIQGLIDSLPFLDVLSQVDHTNGLGSTDNSAHDSRIGSLLNRYERAIRELNEIGRLSADFGLTYELSTEPKLLFHFDWNTTIPGVWVTFSRDGHLHSTLLGFPLTGMTTNTYGPDYFGGTPPAANLIRITPHLMLFVSESNSPPDDLLDAIITGKEQEAPDIPVCFMEQRGPLLDVEVNDPVVVEAPASPGRQEILGIVMEEMPDIHLVGIVTSGYPQKELIARCELEGQSTSQW